MHMLTYETSCAPAACPAQTPHPQSALQRSSAPPTHPPLPAATSHSLPSSPRRAVLLYLATCSCLDWLRTPRHTSHASPSSTLTHLHPTSLLSMKRVQRVSPPQGSSCVCRHSTLHGCTRAWVSTAVKTSQTSMQRRWRGGQPTGRVACGGRAVLPSRPARPRHQSQK